MTIFTIKTANGCEYQGPIAGNGGFATSLRNVELAIENANAGRPLWYLREPTKGCALIYMHGHGVHVPLRGAVVKKGL